MKTILSKNFLTSIFTIILFAIALPAFAGPASDFINSGKAATYIVQVVFGLLGAGLLIKVLHEFGENQKVDNAALKILAMVVCVALVAKPGLITTGITQLGL